MKNVTISIDDRVLAKVRAKAAEHKLNLSDYIADVLGRATDEDGYEAAYRAWRAAKPFPLSGPPQPYPKREELYDRAALRREEQMERQVEKKAQKKAK